MWGTCAQPGAAHTGQHVGTPSGCGGLYWMFPPSTGQWAVVSGGGLLDTGATTSPTGRMGEPLGGRVGVHLPLCVCECLYVIRTAWD